VTPATSSSSRRRRAEHARASSDVRRRRGWLLAATLGSAGVLAALLFRDGARTLASPGPVGPPHAVVACAGCHGDSGAPARTTCTTCHAGHPSTRPAHRALAAQGTLTCTVCHGGHQAESGVLFESNGAVSIYRGGVQHAVVAAARALPGVQGLPAYVPLIARDRCERCHDTRDEGDGALACLSDTAPFALCFDEHRRVATATVSAPARRDALVERARAVAQGPAARNLSGAAANALVVLFGIGVAGLVVVVDRRRRRVAPPSVRATPPPLGVRRLPVIDAARCLGCHACVDACPYDALVVRRYVAVLARPDECCGAGPCQTACPNGSLELLTSGAAAEAPRLSSELEAVNRPGIFLAGDVTGGALVRHALRQGVLAAHAAAAHVERRRREHGPAGAVDDQLVIIGAGPAGLAAALTAQELGLRAVVLEQSRLAASIVSFSRGKRVLDAAGDADERLPLFVGDVTKEELVARWQRTIRVARLEVREGVRVLDITGDARAGFRVRAECATGTGSSVSGTAVILAVGTRGTPRELDAPVAPEASAKVHYELSDARAFAGRRAVVVGLGDVAMETALALAAQPGTDVTVLHRGSGFRRGKQRNIDALAALVARGRVRLVFEARVERVGRATLEVSAAGKPLALAFDALFVHVGRIAAGDLLAQTGMR